MRIVPVTGDLPAVVAAPWPAWAQAEPVTAPPSGTPPVTAAPATSAGAGDRSDRQRRQPQTPLRAAFDPPLIAQRAVLGLPIGPMVAAFARQEGIPHAAASAAVDLAIAAEATAAGEPRDGRRST